MKTYILFALGLFLLACNSENKTEVYETEQEAYTKLIERAKDDPNCAYEIRNLQSEPSGKFMLTSGFRLCDKEVLSNEVIAFEKTEGLGDKKSNIYVSKDLRPIEVKFEGNKLVIYHHNDSMPLLKESSVYNTEIIYKESASIQE